MTTETVDWLLRLPADEIRLSPAMLSKIGKVSGVRIVNAQTCDEKTMRRKVTPMSINDRKIVLEADGDPLEISLVLKGKVITQVWFPEE